MRDKWIALRTIGGILERTADDTIAVLNRYGGGMQRRFRMGHALFRTSEVEELSLTLHPWKNCTIEEHEAEMEAHRLKPPQRVIKMLVPPSEGAGMLETDQNPTQSRLTLVDLRKQFDAHDLWGEPIAPPSIETTGKKTNSPIELSDLYTASQMLPDDPARTELIAEIGRTFASARAKMRDRTPRKAADNP